MRKILISLILIAPSLVPAANAAETNMRVDYGKWINASRGAVKPL